MNSDNRYNETGTNMRHIGQIVKGFGGSALAFILVIVLAGCDSSQGKRDLKTNLRVIHGLSDIESIDILIDGRLSFPGMRYLESTGYFSIQSGPRDIRAVAVGSLATVARSTTALLDDRDQTFLVYGDRENPRGTIILDDADEPSGGAVKLRAIGVSARLTGVDIYLIPPGSSVNDFPPTIRNVQLGTASDYLIGLPGTYSLWVTTIGSKEVRAFIPESVFLEKRLYTLLVADTKDSANPITVVRLEG